jgi:uncharacterized damage-inducible protein DinB
MAYSQTLLPEFDQEMASTRRLLECVPDKIPSYKPHPKSMGFDRLAGHVAELPSWVVSTIDLEVLDLQPGMQPYEPKSKKELLETFDKNVAAARNKILSASDEHLAKTWTLRFAGNEVLSMPRAAVLRGVIMNHLIHHRAQLGVYLRLNDIAIPGMYGPSADEAKFWERQVAAKSA